MLRQNRVLIDMDAIRSNYLVMQNLLPESVPVMPVIKANAYGHGMIETARELSRLGASHFAVAIPEEGIELRLAGIEGEILVLGDAEQGIAILHRAKQQSYIARLFPQTGD